MVNAVVGNSAAGYPHPADPSLRIMQVAVVTPSGLPDLSEGTHAYGYDGNGNLVTDTWTVDGADYTKTFTYNASSMLIGESAWVKQ